MAFAGSDRGCGCWAWSRARTSTTEEVTYEQFVNKELILPHADNERSIPHFMDGLKPSQRLLVSVLSEIYGRR